MKICILGIDGAAPEFLLGNECLANIRRLMELGSYGTLSSVVPPAPVPGWMSLNTSQDPGSMGIYGRYIRSDYGYGSPVPRDSAVAYSAAQSCALWHHLGTASRSILLGVPPYTPPPRVNGVSVGSFLNPDTMNSDFTNPDTFRTKIQELVGEDAVDVGNALADSKDQLHNQILSMSRKQWTVGKWLLQHEPWDFFHLVDIGLQRLLQVCSTCSDAGQAQNESAKRLENLVCEYYQWLDGQIGEILELLDEQTILLLVSVGSQAANTDIVVNQWLIKEGLLVLREPAGDVAAHAKVNIDWAKTRAWNQEGSDGQIFLNVQGREPVGVIPAAEYEAFVADLETRVRAMLNAKGQPLNPAVCIPRQIYGETRGVPPDLIVHFGGSHEGRASKGSFVLVGPTSPLSGEYEGAHVLDIAPTLLDLAGFQIPESMQGRSLIAGIERRTPPSDSSNDDQIIFDRLAGLGYV